jgi:hypothetical protein
MHSLSTTNKSHVVVAVCATSLLPQVFVLDDTLDGATNCSPYAAFNAFCETTERISRRMVDQGLEGQAGVVNKLPVFPAA